MVVVVVPLRYFSNAVVAPRRIGRRFGPRLHQVRRIVDHRRHVALIGAAEIVVRLVFEIALVLDRGSEILGPQPAGTGDRRDLRIVQPDRRHLARIFGVIVADDDPARRHAGRRRAVPEFPGTNPRPPAHCGVSTGTIGDDRAGALAQPDLRQPDHVGALRSGKTAARLADENRRASGRLPGSRSDDAGDNRQECSRVTDFVGVRAGSQRDCKTDKRSRQAEGAIAIDGYFGCHRLRPRPASVGDKAVGAAIIPGRFDAARNAVDAIDAAEQIGLRIRRGRKSVIRTRQVLLRDGAHDERASPAPSVRSGC